MLEFFEALSHCLASLELDQDALAAARRVRADLLEQVRRAKETIRQSKELAQASG
jgi:hypothetical protein